MMFVQSDCRDTKPTGEEVSQTHCDTNLWERLNELAQKDIVTFSETIGEILASRSDLYNFTILQYSKSLIRTLRICERIDYLLPRDCIKSFAPRDMNIMRKHVEWECVDDNTYQISDINGFFDYITVQISNTDGIYEVCAPSHAAFWRFSVQNGELVLSEPQLYFYDPRKTRCAMMLIEWFSNMVNFQEKKVD